MLCMNTFSIHAISSYSAKALLCVFPLRDFTEMCIRDSLRTLAGSVEYHIAYASAVRHAAELGRADIIRISGDIGYISG